jgi:hypothetical protein
VATPRHVNSGACDKCVAILDSFPGLHAGLRNWFLDLQKKDPTAHVSCAGRGKKAQEEAFAAGTSRAHFGQSAHNYNAAIDIFRLTADSQLSYERSWFDHVIGKAVQTQNEHPAPVFKIEWYGQKGSPYFELPHCEVKDWKELVAQGKQKLVEDKT